MAQRNGTGMFPREVVQKPQGGFCQGAPSGRDPEPLSGAGVGASLLVP
jgi:hypothetical protein